MWIRESHQRSPNFAYGFQSALGPRVLNCHMATLSLSLSQKFTSGHAPKRLRCRAPNDHAPKHLRCHAPNCCKTFFRRTSCLLRCISFCRKSYLWSILFHNIIFIFQCKIIFYFIVLTNKICTKQHWQIVKQDKSETQEEISQIRNTRRQTKQRVSWRSSEKYKSKYMTFNIKSHFLFFKNLNYHKMWFKS